MKKNKVAELAVQVFKILKLIVIQMVWYWHKTDKQKSGTEQRYQKETHACRITSSLTKVALRSSGKNVFLNFQCQNNLISIWKKIKLDLYLKPYLQINSRCIVDLKVKKKKKPNKAFTKRTSSCPQGLERLKINGIKPANQKGKY